MLDVRDIAVSYGRHRALERVSVTVGKGEICVILGANGAGKSTLLKTIAGMVRAEAGGDVYMNGKRISGLKPHQIVEEGIALVPEGRGIFGDLSVAENLSLGSFAARARRDEAAALASVYALFPRLAERKRQVARTMSGGEQQMVAIGRALMSRPEILMLDEPSLGLSPLLTKELFKTLKSVAEAGVGILLVEQNARQSLGIADRGYLIENGAVVGENSARSLMSDPAVINAYLGGAGGRAVRAKVNLPPPMRLPSGIEAMRGLMGDLAERATRIQSAFVRSLRQGADLPSAFVGRFDPAGDADPWTDFEPPPLHLSGGASRVADDTRRLGEKAGELARSAAERHARHVRSARLSAPTPSAFSTRHRHDPVVANVARAPERRTQGMAGLNGLHGRIGHNSGGLDLDPPDGAAGNGDAVVAKSPTAAELAARAASIQAAHVAARRKAATALAAPAEKRPPKKKRSKSKLTAKKKRERRKEA